MVFNNVQLPVSILFPDSFIFNSLRSFPLDIVFRIYDNCLASGIEAIFGFSIALLHKNEDLLLDLKFDEILAFLNNKLFDRYKVNCLFLRIFRWCFHWQTPQVDHAEGEEKDNFRVDEFVNDAVSLRISPFMLDSYSHEYEDMIVSRTFITLCNADSGLFRLIARDQQTCCRSRWTSKQQPLSILASVCSKSSFKKH